MDYEDLIVERRGGEDLLGPLQRALRPLLERREQQAEDATGHEDLHPGRVLLRRDDVEPVSRHPEGSTLHERSFQP